MALACCVQRVTSSSLNLVSERRGIPLSSSVTYISCGRKLRGASLKCQSLGNQKMPAVIVQASATSATTADAAEPESDDTSSDSAADGGDSSAQQDAAEEVQAPQRIKKTKSLIHILETLHKRAIENLSRDKVIPDIRPGYVVQLKVEVPDQKRLQVLKGIIICRRNNGVNTTFTTRRIIAGVAVEMVFPLYSPIIKEITVLEKRKVRRAKLYYLRDKLPKFSTC